MMASFPAVSKSSLEPGGSRGCARQALPIALCRETDNHIFLGNEQDQATARPGALARHPRCKPSALERDHESGIAASLLASGFYCRSRVWRESRAGSPIAFAGTPGEQQDVGADPRGYAADAGTHRAGFVWIVPGASGARDLRGHLRSELEAVRLERLPERCAGGDPKAGRADYSLSGRKFCVGLQLAGWDWSQGKAPGGVGQGVEFDEFERVWDRRVSDVVPRGGHGAAARAEPGYWNAGAGGGLGGILQRR